MRQAVSDNSLIVDFDNEVQVMFKGGGGDISGSMALGIKVKVTRKLVFVIVERDFLERHVTFKT